MNRIRINEVLIVEGKYDAIKLASIVDGLVLTTSGFGIYSNDEKKELIRRLGKQCGIIILTDSDAAGFQIRHYVQSIAKGCSIKHAYVPVVRGKERRKTAPSKEGVLGVEGLPKEVLRAALIKAGVVEASPKEGRNISYTDLFEAGISGGAGSAKKRREFLQGVGLPARLSKKALVEVLNSMYSYDEFTHALEDKPVLYWDFHGTLTTADVNWISIAEENAQELAPEISFAPEALLENLKGQCLPWFTFEDGDTNAVKGADNWWAYTENNFVEMYIKCGFKRRKAQEITKLLRGKILQKQRYFLYEDAVFVLATLQKRGYQSHIISNNFPELEQLMQNLGLMPYFGKVIVSGQVGYEKPREEIFIEALQQTGSPAQKVMIGDNPIADVQGGKKVGFITVAVHANAKIDRADYTVDALSELLDIFV